MTTVLDPTGQQRAAQIELTPRPDTLEGLTVGLLDITKARGDVFMNRLDELLQDRGIETKRFSKPTFTKPAPVDLRHEISLECQVVIEALAD